MAGQPVEPDIVGDAVDPSTEATETVERADVLPRMDERLLRQVVSESLIAVRLDKEIPAHGALVLPHQAGEGMLVVQQHHAGYQHDIRIHLFRGFFLLSPLNIV